MVKKPKQFVPNCPQTAAENWMRIYETEII